MDLIREALQHMYFTMPHKKQEIEIYCRMNNIPLEKQAVNSFDPDDIFGSE